MITGQASKKQPGETGWNCCFSTTSRWLGNSVPSSNWLTNARRGNIWIAQTLLLSLPPLPTGSMLVKTSDPKTFGSLWAWWVWYVSNPEFLDFEVSNVIISNHKSFGTHAYNNPDLQKGMYYYIAYAVIQSSCLNNFTFSQASSVSWFVDFPIRFSPCLGWSWFTSGDLRSWNEGVWKWCPLPRKCSHSGSEHDFNLIYHDSLVKSKGYRCSDKQKCLISLYSFQVLTSHQNWPNILIPKGKPTKNRSALMFTGRVKHDKHVMVESLNHFKSQFSSVQKPFHALCIW